MAGYIALAVASSGIASTLLDAGTTAHTQFGLSIEPSYETSSSIKGTTASAALFRAAKLIILDEVTMLHRYTIEELDHLLKLAMSDIDPTLANVPFDGKLILFGGDWAQRCLLIRNRPWLIN